ncbi:MAG: FAD-dependent thymidylate synthase [Deltaproteobacteria bacterium]|nr:FAD-dependent thymidylate synthase [Deltaproteobacteria bacterium]
MEFNRKSPKIKLIEIIPKPYNLSIATARTCYSSKGIITPEEVDKDEKSRALRDRIAQSTLEAGHLTTRQHAHFVFSMDAVSRSFIWSFLHSHPFYNSEQVSQRYVRVQPDNFHIPDLKSENLKIYEDALSMQMENYNQLIELVKPTIQKEYYKIFPHRLKNREKWGPLVLKKTYEVARYCLPIATHAYLYHTISALTLMRYYKMASIFDTPCEQKLVIDQMISEVRKHDPLFEKELQDPYPLEATPEFKLMEEFGTTPSMSFQRKLESSSFTKEFDHTLEGRWSKLIDYKINAEHTLARSVRTILGIPHKNLPDHEAIERVLNPKYNPYLSDTLNPNMHTKLSRALCHVHFTFRKKLSHTADSQEQRHRMTPGSRPVLETHYHGKPDYITPLVIKQTPQAEEVYEKTMENSYKAINQLLEKGESFENAHYLLPNAHAIRFEESGDLLNFHHKWKLRTCYNAQEEIFYSSIDELVQVNQVFPLIGKHILAPCYLRKQAEKKPYCPEGDRYCGVPVWRKEIKEYKRLI